MTKKRQAKAMQERLPLPPLPRWRWLAYATIAGIVFAIIFVKIGGVLPRPVMSLAAWRDSGQLAYLGASIVFSGLIVALIKIFFDQVLLGFVQRKSKRVIAEELGVLVAQVAVGVAADGLISAAASAGSSSDSQAGGISSGGGGDFGGGGASGRF